jgi:hypothetical protein
LLEAEVLATAGAEIDTRAVGEVLKRAADVLGAEAWSITARLAKLTGNAAWEALAERQLEHLIEMSGSHASAVRTYAESQRARLSSSS